MTAKSSDTWKPPVAEPEKSSGPPASVQIRLILAYIFSICASGLLGGWPVLSGLLERSGLFLSACPPSTVGSAILHCRQQSLLLSQIYTVAHGVLTFSHVFIGAIFDRWGGRSTCVVGGVTQIIGIILVMAALLVTNRSLLHTEQALMYVGLIMCDIGMVCMRFATISFTWYFPTRRGFVMGLANSASACSTLVVMLIKVAMVRTGAALWKCFLVYGAIIVVSTIGLNCVVPNQIEFLGEAEKVNGYRAETIRGESTFRWFMRGLKVAGQKPYRWVNLLFMVAWTSYLCYVIFTFSNMYFYFRELFQSDTAAEGFAIVYSWLQLVNTGFLSGLYGLISDMFGLGFFALTMFILNAVQFATVLIPSKGAQVVQLFAATTCWSLVGNFIFQYGSFYIPANLQGAFSGINSLQAGICQIVCVSIAQRVSAMRHEGVDIYQVPISIFGPISIFLMGCQAIAILVLGVPSVPPREDTKKPTQDTPLLPEKADKCV